MNREERLRLMEELLSASISEADRLRLEAELIVDASARRDYYDQVQLHQLLQQEAQLNGGPSPILGSSSFSNRRRNLLAFVSIVSIAASFMAMVLLGNPFASQPTIQASASGYAVLQSQDEAIWTDRNFRDGDLLPAGQLQLESGLAIVELFSGVEVIVQGDSLFSIDSPMQITMTRGTARARVPQPAQGFRIKTSAGDVVDLGTEFSIQVDPTGADVHVLDGEVELHSQVDSILRLDAGQSRRLSGDDGIVVSKALPNQSLGIDQVNERIIRKRQNRRSAWLDWQSRAASDPNLIAHYRFAPRSSQSRIIENLAEKASPIASDGKIVAAAYSADRWGQSDSALDFSPIGSRVRVNVSGEYRSLTMLCWVKIHSLDRMYNSLFLTDGHEDGEPHWQLMNDGRIFFSIKVPRTGEGQSVSQPVFYSPKIWEPSFSGRWIMLAVTYDSEARQVTHYLDGRPIGNAFLDEASLVPSIRIGHASIANWNQPVYRQDPEFVIRNLNGNMDELAIYSSALSANEILNWYKTGRPNE